MYKWDAKAYSKNSKNQKRWAEGLLSRISFRGDENILDIGCGEGKITRTISEEVPKGHVTGIDSSQDMIALAGSTAKSRYKNLFFKKKNACRLGFRNKFDIIVSTACFHWIADHDALIGSVHQALKPGGKLFAQMGAKGNAAALVKAVTKLIRKKKWREYFKDFIFPYHFSTRSAFSKILKRQGLKIRLMSTFFTYMEYDSPAEFKSALRTFWMPFLNKVPEKLHEEFLIETVAQYLKDNPPDKKGRVRIKMKRLEFCAEKPLKQ